MGNNKEDYSLFEAAQEAIQNNKPDSRWIKVQLAKVLVKYIDPIEGKPTETVIEGDASKNEEACIFDCWTPLETAYFTKMNKYHILEGNIVPYKKDMVVEISPNTITDEDLREVLTKPFLTIRSLLSKFTSTVPVERMLAIAEEMNKPSGTVTAIKKRLSELQEEQYNG